MLPFEKFIKGRMSEKRFIHSVNVAKTARWLALKYGANEEKATIAGILHDVTKEWKIKDHLEFLHKKNIGITKYEYASKKLYHSITGACLVKSYFKIDDLDVFNAIRFHTTARPGMSTLEKIIYVADFISDDRSFSGVDRLRALAALNLDSAVFAGLEETIKDLVHDGSIVHPNTFNAYNEYIFKINDDNVLKYKKSNSFFSKSKFL